MASNQIGHDPAAWASEHIHAVTRPFFRLATKLGSGENASVYALGYFEHQVWYSSEDESEDASDHSMDVDGDKKRRRSKSRSSEYSDSGSDYSDRSRSGSSSSCSYEYGEEEAAEEAKAGDTQKGTQEEEEEPVVLTVPENESDRRVTRETCMGKTQLVCKVFRHLNEGHCASLYDKTTGKLIVVLEDDEECEDYVKRRRIKQPVEVRDVEQHITPPSAGQVGAVKLLDFPNESLVNLFLTRLVVQAAISPHITMTLDAFTCRNTGFLLMERMTCTLDDVLNCEPIERSVRRGLSSPLFNVTELCSLFFQTLFALVSVQRVCKLKHHDLHSGNVFLKRIDEHAVWRGAPLLNATHFHYHLDGTDFYVPNSGFIAKIGDFGMSSMDVRNHRLQRMDMDLFNDEPEKWGHWSAEYEGERGYDGQVLFADVPVDGRHRSCSELHHFLKHVRVSTSGKKGKVSRKKFRPLPGHVSNLPADSILRAIFVRNVRPSYNFLQPPPAESNPVVVTLGDSRWQS